LEKWAKEKEAGKISMDAVEELLNGKHTILFSLDCIADFDKIPYTTPIEAPLNTNVWKADVKEGDKIEKEES
jgi:biotin carboxyl carrier protein